MLAIIPYFTFTLSVFFLQEIPFKPKEEFEIKLNYQFRQWPQADVNTVNLADSRYQRSQHSGVLPYLILNIKLLKLSEEKMRVRITRNIDDRPVNKKVNVNAVIELDMGFTDDMKDRVKAYEYTLSFLTADKIAVSKIFISIDEDGSFLVNGEKRGRF